MKKTWYFKYEFTHFCVKYTKGQYWFFLGKEKLKTVWYAFMPYVCYDIIVHFENNIKQIEP